MVESRTYQGSRLLEYYKKERTNMNTLFILQRFVYVELVISTVVQRKIAAPNTAADSDTAPSCYN